MSTGKSEAKRSARAAEAASVADRTQRVQIEEKLKKERVRSQNMFIRQVRARQGGGFFQDSGPTNPTLG